MSDVIYWQKVTWTNIWPYTYKISRYTKLINTINKEENQIIVKKIEKSQDKLFEMDDFNGWVIQPSNWCIDLKDAIDLILDFNENELKDLVWKYKN